MGLYDNLDNDEWRKSSLCGSSACVLVSRWHDTAIRENRVAIKRSGNPGVILFTEEEWRSFCEGVRLGEFDV